MKIVLLGVLALATRLALAAFVISVAGARMPRQHRSRIAVTLPARRAAVWAAITDYAAMPGWWPAVKAVRTETLADGTVLTWNADDHGREVGCAPWVFPGSVKPALRRTVAFRHTIRAVGPEPAFARAALTNAAGLG